MIYILYYGLPLRYLDESLVYGKDGMCSASGISRYRNVDWKRSSNAESVFPSNASAEALSAFLLNLQSVANFSTHKPSNL